MRVNHPDHTSLPGETSSNFVRHQCNIASIAQAHKDPRCKLGPSEIEAAERPEMPPDRIEMHPNQGAAAQSS